MASLAADDLLLQMRRATRRAHNIANALILSKLVVVLTDRQLYAQALGSFLPVYQQLEREAQKHTHLPGLGLVIAAAATIPSRAAAMQDDLAHLLGPGWRSKLPPSPAAEAYAAHIAALSARNPTLLLPYVFSLHVPILLGFLGRRIQTALQLPDARGLAFFTVSAHCSTWWAMLVCVAWT
jgi:heme oxygenase